jgi:hypothetical protein
MDEQTDMMKLTVTFHRSMTISSVPHFVTKKAIFLFFITFNSKPGQLSWYSDCTVGGCKSWNSKRFSFLQNVQTDPQAHPAPYPTCTGALSPRCKAAEPFPSTAEVKMPGAIPPLPMYAFMAQTYTTYTLLLFVK